MNTNAPLLLLVSKLCTGVALIGFLYLVISSLLLHNAGFFSVFPVTAFAALIGLTAAVTLLIMGSGRTGILLLLLIGNALLILACIFMVICFGLVVRMQ